MEIDSHKKVMDKFFTVKNYIILLLIFIVYYSFIKAWEIVFIFLVLLMIFIRMKNNIKKDMLEEEEN